MAVCFIPLCRNPVADPCQPCEPCVEAFGPYLRDTGRPVTDALRAEMAAAVTVPAPEPRPAPEPSCLRDEELAEEVAHFAGYGWDAAEIAGRLGASLAAVQLVLARLRGRAA